MQKYALLRAQVKDQLAPLGVRLMVPPAASDEELLLVHEPVYLESLKNGTLCRKIERQIGFPYSPAMVERSRRSVGATVAACRAALDEGVGASLAGGTHHAFAGRGEGFCVFNDSAVAIRVLQGEGRIKRALILDTDVHQGNGTAAIFQSDPTVFTFSIHGAKNYPFRKEISDLDIALEDGAGDEEFLGALHRGLLHLQQVEADLVVFQSGADPYEHDKLGRLGVTMQGLAERDRMVLGWCAQRGLPVGVTMGGGYCPRVEEIVAIHFQTVQQALALYQDRRKTHSDLSPSL